MHILSLLVFEVLKIDSLERPTPNFYIFSLSPRTISCWYLLTFLLHVTMSDAPSHQKGFYGQVVFDCFSCSLQSRSDVQELSIYQHEGTGPLTFTENL